MSATTTTATATSRPVTQDNVLRLFPDVNVSLASSHRVSTTDVELQGYDEEQVRLMEEVCIVLDRDDRPIGSASKKVCMFSTCHSLNLSSLDTLRPGLEQQVTS